MYYDRQGRPMTQEQWIKDFEDFEVKRVTWTEVSEDIKVSTVWLGLDHSYGDGPPLIFETLVLGGSLDGDMLRYSTESQAVEGHQKMVDLVTAVLAKEKLEEE
jgi:hypothetical protein